MFEDRDLVIIRKAPETLPDMFTPLEPMSKLIGTIGEIYWYDEYRDIYHVITQPVRGYIGSDKSQWVDEDVFAFEIGSLDSFLK